MKETIKKVFRVIGKVIRVLFALVFLQISLESLREGVMVFAIFYGAISLFLWWSVWR